MSMRQNKPLDLTKLDNPKETEKDYVKWREDHRRKILEQAQLQIKATMGYRSSLKAPVAILAGITGLSDATVRKYCRHAKIGKRGPLLTTYLALQLLDKV